jgi:hypothetical protein
VVDSDPRDLRSTLIRGPPVVDSDPRDLRSTFIRATACAVELIQSTACAVDGWWLSAPASQAATSDIVERIGTGEPGRHPIARREGEVQPGQADVPPIGVANSRHVASARSMEFGLETNTVLWAGGTRRGFAA